MRALLVLLLLVHVAHADPYVDAAPSCVADRTYCFAIALHVAHDGETPVASPDFIAGQIARANELYALISASFHIVSVDDASVPSVGDTKVRRSLAAHVTPGVIHVFLTGALADVDRAGEQIRGVTLRQRAGKYIILSAIAMDRVLAHELGHVFGLPHSTYDVSLMNKTKRATPIEARTFAPEEITAMTATAAALVRSKVYRNDLAR